MSLRALRPIAFALAALSLVYIVFHSSPTAASAKDAFSKAYQGLVPPPEPADPKAEVIHISVDPRPASEKSSDAVPTHNIPPKPVTVVVSSISNENVTWLDELPAEWNVARYINDDMNAEYAIPGNKGRECMSYLSYIIDHYDDLSPITIFHHAERFQWHTDDPAYDGLRQLQRLRLPAVAKAGYANLRCSWDPGCPEGYPVYREPKEEHVKDDGPMNEHYPSMYQYIFNTTDVPAAASQPCCAEFAVADWQIKARPRREYVRTRRWLIETWLGDGFSGRLMEYAWHILFGQKAILCPNAKECYCRLYGYCDLECPEKGDCKVWHNPSKRDFFFELPKRWPDYDFDGQPQDVAKVTVRK